MLGHKYGIQVTHARGEAGGPKLPPPVKDCHLPPSAPSLCRLYRTPAFRPLFPLPNLVLSTSCSASNFSYFEQLFSFRATLCRVLNNFSSYVLILRYRSSFWGLNWPFFHISQCFSRQFSDNLWISCKKRSQIFLPCWEGFGFACGPPTSKHFRRTQSPHAKKLSIIPRVYFHSLACCNPLAAADRAFSPLCSYRRWERETATSGY